MFERIRGKLMNTVAFGTGEPSLVLVGGWIGPWQVWRQTMEILSTEHRCVAYDHRGAGQTVTDPSDFAFDGLVDDVVALMDHFEIERCWLAGESQGGTVACAAALRHPSRFFGQVLIGANPEIVFGELQRSFAEMLDSEQADAALDMFVDLVVTEPDADHYKRWLRSMLDEAEPGAGSGLLRAIGGTSIEPDLGGVTIPTLVIHGADDRVMSLAGAETFADRIPRARLEVLDGVGHVPTITSPHRTAELIRSFIAEHTA